jgi:membrane protein DedA with SNARE-associated domain
MGLACTHGFVSAGPEDAVGALQEFVGDFTYLGIFVVLLLRSLGVPIPEEMPIIAAAVLSHEGIVRWWLVLPVCPLGVLSGDMVLYWVGRHWGEQVLNWRLVRLVLSSAREQWLKATYRRHALKTVVTARHIMGLRAAVFPDRGQCERAVLEAAGPIGTCAPGGGPRPRGEGG